MNSGKRRGLFITLDGPGGIGKSTTCAVVAQQLRALSIPVHTTREPTDTPLGNLARHGTDEYQGLAMAHLIAADRYHHITTEIRPALTRGELVVCDRYLASSLVLQRIDGLPAQTVWDLNGYADLPDLSVILTGDPEVIHQRLTNRGPHSRYEKLPDSSRTEVKLFTEAAQALTTAGFHTLVLDGTDATPENLAHTITAEITDLRSRERS